TGKELAFVEADTNIVKQINLADQSVEQIAHIPTQLSTVNVDWSADLNFSLIEGIEQGSDNHRFYLLKKQAKQIVRLDDSIIAAGWVGSTSNYLVQRETNGRSEISLATIDSTNLKKIRDLDSDPRVIKPVSSSQTAALPDARNNGKSKILIYESEKLREIGPVELGTISILPLQVGKALVDLFDAQNVSYQLATLDLNSGAVERLPLKIPLTDAVVNTTNQGIVARTNHSLVGYGFETGGTEQLGEGEELEQLSKIIVVPDTARLILLIDNKLFELTR
ncbi:hypothetical protein HYZ64_00260, partial [Candidatus Berkelbacteria bacterium]|nr:hypothetical protein [Candidatus Berkelbacteria bacterium]